MSVGLVLCPCWANLPPISLAYLSGSIDCAEVEVYDFNHQFCKKYLSNYRDVLSPEFEDIQAYMGETSDFDRFEQDVLDFSTKYADDLLNWKKQLKNHHLIGFSLYQSNLVPSVALAREIKKEGLILIAGGPSVSMDKLSFSRYLIGKDVFDIGVLGIGEDVVNELLVKLHSKKSIKNIPGLVLKCKNELHFTPEKKPDLSKAHFPSYDKFDLNDYFRGYEDRMFIYSVVGCVGKCEFCTIHEMYTGFATKPIENIIAEIEYLKAKHGFEKFFLSDGMFLGKTAPAKALFQYAIANNIALGIQIRMRKYWLDEELVELASKCVYYFQIGFESASPTVRRAMRKLVDEETTKSIFKLFYKHRLPLYVNIIVGYPNEDEDEFQHTHVFVDEFSKKDFTIGCGTNSFFIPNSFPVEKYQIRYKEGHWFSPKSSVYDRVYRVERLCRVVEANKKNRGFIYYADNVEGVKLNFLETTPGIAIGDISFDEVSALNAGYFDKFVELDWGYYYIQGWAVDSFERHPARFVILTNESRSFKFPVQVKYPRPDVASNIAREFLCSGFEAFINKKLLPPNITNVEVFAVARDGKTASRLHGRYMLTWGKI